jgi:hypothetical protein
MVTQCVFCGGELLSVSLEFQVLEWCYELALKTSLKTKMCVICVRRFNVCHAKNTAWFHFKDSEGYVASPCFRATCFTRFFLSVLCQYTPLLNLHLLIFGLTPISWPRSVTLTPVYSIISDGNITFDLCPTIKNTTGP